MARIKTSSTVFDELREAWTINTEPARIRLHCEAILLKHGGESAYVPKATATKQRPRREQAAVNMLKNGTSPAAAATLIKDRYGCSGRTALRDVTAATKSLRQMSKNDGAVAPDDVRSNSKKGVGANGP